MFHSFIKWFWSVEWKHGFTQMFIVLDQVANVFLFNPFSKNTWADETISSRMGRFHDTERYYWRRKFIDGIWQYILRKGPDHCKKAHEKELARYNFPPSMRK